jgi:class 3 adenylate cyclase/predicted nucleic acid-binding protein
VIVCASCGHENGDAARFCEACGAALGAASGEHRKVVTVLFCDVVGSTALGESMDPEALRGLLARYFERMRAIVEAHEGSVEKFIGDAVMAVFGVPAAHEDDALRACRAAVEMREAFPELGIEGRIGVTTGEVVTGTEERLATGDAVNVAARLQQAAEPGEILVGAETVRLARDAVESEPVEPLTVKGKSEPVLACRLVSAREGTARRLDAPIVGRERELATLRESWKHVRAETRCELVTVLGTPGVGKSRLAAELIAEAGARVVRGRCIPYGEGISYWPVVEVVKQLEDVEVEAPAAEAIRSLLGENILTTGEENAWAVRKLLEAAAPLVVIFDDIQWGEETFLDLVEHIALLSSEASILLLCCARPELLDRRPGWPVTLRLEPLPEDACELLIDDRLAGRQIDDGLRSRIRSAAGGNPLFVEEMVAMLGHATDAEVVVPPTIQALLAARIDHLEPEERRVLERGSVEGEVFHRGAVQALAPDEQRVTTRLTGLVRKEFVRPDRSQFPGDDGFRFRHLLIRDAAYDALPKAVRAELHERFAGWLLMHAGDLVEADEVIGYHFEQAHRYRAELGHGGAETTALALRAGELLAAASGRALLRDDLRAGVNLLERAVALLPPEGRGIELDLDLADALFRSSRFADADAVAKAAAERAAAAGDDRGELLAELQQRRYQISLDPANADFGEFLELAQAALSMFEAAGDDAGLAAAWHAIAYVEHNRLRHEAKLAAAENGLEHARRAGLHRYDPELRWFQVGGYYWGPTPVEEFLRWLDSNRGLETRAPILVLYRAGTVAALGRFDEARHLVAAFRARGEELGHAFWAAASTQQACRIETLAGNLEAAEREIRQGCELWEAAGERAYLSTFAGGLAKTLAALGRLDEAEEWAGRSAELGVPDDVATQMLWREAQASVHALRGEPVEAERLAREAISLIGGSDDAVFQPDAWFTLGEILALARKTDEAEAVLEEALGRYEQKGNLVMADRTRRRLAELQEVAPR